MDIIQGRCDKVTNLLHKRELERKSDIEKKLQDKKAILAEHERIEVFETTFGEKRLEIENALNLAPSLSTRELPNHLDTIFKNILNLQKYGASSKIFLRMYDVEKCHQCIHDLTTRAKDLEEKLMPKKKFGFKNKSKVVAPINGHSKDVVDYCSQPTFKFDDNLCGFENRYGETLILPSSEIYKKDVRIRKVENCVIKLYGTPSTLHLNQLKNCLVFCGPVSTSIFAENCTSSKLVIACQQLRLHSSTDIHIYLHVTSRAIIEDCSEVLVAPYNFRYEGLDDDFNNSGLDPEVNHWSTLDDFNWLNVERQSPNWNILSDSERISDWNNYTLPAR
ncbi:hypothetical protein RN001_003893 [Aquatica leii]|uniref:C-CAP/cofactor C-like domain-containing protein n=1 Tax=Aquatica leii TaxID=1421715 RepID=A0AAN7PIZ5_9COLE|nr:hypothetical protein RN001_003893 [Aquatica leii]